MAERNDTILTDMISESFGGSAYHNFDITLSRLRHGVARRHSNNYIAPRALRLLNARVVSPVLYTGANTSAHLERYAHNGVFTGRAIHNFNPEDFTARQVVELNLGTESSGNLRLPNVVARQYDFFNFSITPHNTTTGSLPSISLMCHYAFEDV